MSLTRVHNPLSLALIRRLGDAGGPRADHVADELDNIIAWASAAPRCIQTDTSTVGNGAGVATTLHTFSLPAGSLATDNDYLRVRYAGSFGATNNSKTISVSFGGVSVIAAALDVNGTGWVYDLTLTRVSATSVRASYTALWGFINRNVAGTVGGNANIFSVPPNDLAVSNLNSNAQTMLVQGNGAAANDVVQNLSIIELRQQ